MVSPWRMHCMYSGMAKGTSWAEATLNSEKIKPVTLAIVELREYEGIRQAGSLLFIYYYAQKPHMWVYVCCKMIQSTINITLIQIIQFLGKLTELTTSASREFHSRIMAGKNEHRKELRSSCFHLSEFQMMTSSLWYRRDKKKELKSTSTKLLIIL